MMVDAKYYGTGRHFIVNATSLDKAFEGPESLIREMEPPKEKVHYGFVRVDSGRPHYLIIKLVSTEYFNYEFTNQTKVVVDKSEEFYSKF